MKPFFYLREKLRNSDFLLDHPYLSEFLRSIYFFITSFNYNSRLFVVIDSLNLIYLINYKVAYSSVISTLYNFMFPNKSYPKNITSSFKLKTKLGSKEESYFKFTFVRNPFDRVVSFFLNRVKNKTKRFPYLFGYFKDTDSFETVVKKISKIPDFLAENHFKSQYSLIYHKGKPLVDFIGRFENIDKDWEIIRKKVPGLPKLPKFNVSKKKKDWRDYYTPELAKLVYKRYKKDFEIWYPNAYDELMEYLEKKKE